jgi:hypothetical protein
MKGGEIMKHIIKVVLPLFSVIPMLLIPSAVYADDGDMNVDIGITTPGTANVGVGIDANEANVWINGYGLDSLAAGMGYQAGAVAGSAAFQHSASNSQFSQVGTGLLPPLSSIPAVAEVAPDGKYDAWTPGWQGYFCPHTNLDPMVYHGSGCGGTWGVCDGYPDMWCRRQLAGLAPEFVVQKEKLNTVIEALAKVITVTEANNHALNGNGAAVLKAQLAQLEDVSLGLSVLEQEHAILETSVQKQQDDFNKKLAILASAFGFAILCLIGAVAYLVIYVRRRLLIRSYREL